MDDASQSLGQIVPGWTPRPLPPRTPMRGRFCVVDPLDCARHAADLFAANMLDRAGTNWNYLPYGPFAEIGSFRAWVENSAASSDPLFFAIIDAKSDKAVGVASFLRMDTENGVVEVGHLNYSPLLQRKPAATEAMYLMMRCIFDELGYRRYEWKCNALNAASRTAATRLGFKFEGIFRQDRVVKGRNRDTAWFSIIDSEWPKLKLRFERWLAPENFDRNGRQISRLSELT